MRRTRTALHGLLVAGAFLLVAPSARAGGPGPPVSSSGPGSGSGSGSGSGRGGPGSSRGNGRIIARLPDGTLRDLCTSFTQVTESPFALDDGKLALAAGEVSASAARLDTLRSRSVDAGGLGLARGLPHRWTVSATLDAWSGLGLTTGPVSGETSPGGFGGGAIAAQHTFFGVDSAGVALGVVASVTLPAASASPLSTSYGAALALPFAASLPLEVSLGAMAQVASLADAADTGRHLRFVDSVKLERELVPHVSGWVEGVSVADREPGYAWLTTVNGGLAADLGRHIGVSLGVAAGHTERTTDHGVFGGIGLHL